MEEEGTCGLSVETETSQEATVVTQVVGDSGLGELWALARLNPS
jgi:hypothetical protein